MRRALIITTAYLFAIPLAAAADAIAGGAAGDRAGGAAVGVRSTSFGRILADGRGRTLYLFTHDRRGLSRCYGKCAKAWPPFLTKGSPRAARGARASLLGTTRRRDGTSQVTYRGQPLYYYVGETRAGQVLCQNVVEYGGRWLIVSRAARRSAELICPASDGGT